MIDLIHGNCLDVLKTLPDNSVDAVITDPPYELGFMGKSWDKSGIAYNVNVWLECLRVLKGGGHLLAFGGSRTYHRMACAIEDAGFEIRDQIMWVYGCLDDQTELATRDGVKPYHKAVIGEPVLCYNPQNGEYSYQPIQEIVEYEYSDTAYRLIGDFGEQIVTRNHRVIVERGGMETYQFAETLECEACVPVLESLPELNAVCNQCGTQGIRGWKGHKTAMVRVVPFHYTGKVWCLRVPTGAFVAVRNGVAFPTGNSGFPKSLDISKTLYKLASAKREPILDEHGNQVWTSQKQGKKSMFDGGKERPATCPATEAAKQWSGWGTALKPAHEDIVLARKPLAEKTIAENVLKHGTGGLNIDGCRVGIEQIEQGRKGRQVANSINYHNGLKPVEHSTATGRFPANFIHDGSEEVVALFPDSKSTGGKNAIRNSNYMSLTNGYVSDSTGGYGDIGSNSRFFYCAKASKTDRNEGCEGLLARQARTTYDKSVRDSHGNDSGHLRLNHHPTVKPNQLMRYLCRLITPPNGVILDPFMGSGSTGKAAKLEGFSFIGIELEPEYFEIAQARINGVKE